MSDLRISCRLEGGETGPDNEHAAAESTKGLVETRWPEQQATNRENGKTSHEGDTETKSSKNPTRDCRWANEVSAKIGRRETSSHGRINGKSFLEVRVQNIEETVGEAPKEEKDSYYSAKLVSAALLFSRLAS
jgi:hypothetical protein